MTRPSHRLVLLLLIILLLVAIVSAQPDGPSYDPMGFNWSYDDTFGVLANDQIGQMVIRAVQDVWYASGADIDETANPLPHYVDPTQLSQPFVGGGRATHRMLGQAVGADNMRQPSPQGFGSGRTYAAALQYGTPSQPQNQMVMVPQEQATDYFATQRIEQPMQAVLNEPSPPFAGPKRTRTYAEVLRSEPAGQNTFGMDTFAQAHEGYIPSVHSNVANQQPILPNDITSNPNFHLGMAEPADTVADWISQPRTARDRLRPTVDTTHLTPHLRRTSRSPSTARSPASITSPSSSRISSTRRSKHQIHNSPFSPHQCLICSAGFDARTDLTHHMRIHGDRPFVCRTCRKRFLYNKDLRRHELVHAGKGFFCPHQGCKFATKGFRRDDHLERHLLSQHAVDSGVDVEGSWAAGSSVMGA